MRNGFGSFWLQAMADPGSPRPRLEGEQDVDLAIVGAGLTGLWAAYWSAKAMPGTRIAVLERDRVGYGASGRNGGWLSGKTVGARKALLRDGHGPESVRAIERRVFDAVDEVLDLFAAAGIGIDAHKGGWLRIARSESERDRLRAFVDGEHRWGMADSDIWMLTADQARERIAIDGLHGAAYSPHAAALDPAKMVYGLAHLCERAGVEIFENSEVTTMAPGSVRTERGVLNTPMTVLATEAYTATLKGRRRELLPMLSSMVITEPLTPQDRAHLGWQDRECVGGGQHEYFYAQVTADHRIALGGRGKAYNWASDVDHNGSLNRGTVSALADILGSLFPHVHLRLAHAWSGVLGVPRDWSPFIDLRPEERTLQLGGYVGQGLTASYVAGKTAADLLAGQDTELTRSAWVRRRPRRWEPEPARWLGATGVHKLYRMADAAERRHGGKETSAYAKIANRVAGR